MKLPTEQECLQYFEEFKVPLNILNHCLLVRDVAVFLANKLNEQGEEINIEFVDRLSLLHDLFKTATLPELKPSDRFPYTYSEEEIEMWKELRERYHGLYETEIAYLFFKDKYPELAKSLRLVSSSLEENKSIEEWISHYADWRVFDNKVIYSIHHRVEDLRERYNKEEEYWTKRTDIVSNKEKEVFSKLSFLPEQLAEEMEKHG